MTAAPASLPVSDKVVEACWRHIGTRGDRTCPRLVEYVRCRNCPVFAAGARALLDRSLPDGYAAEWSERVATAKVAQDGGNTLSAVVFRLATEWFALPTEILDEIADTRPIHSLPHRRNPVVLGLCNVRGALIVCVSLHAMLGLAEQTSDDPDRAVMTRPRLVVIRHTSGPVAFRVDDVQPTFRFDEASLRSVPATVAKAASSSYVKGLLPWREGTVGYLDPERTMQAINQSLA